MEICSLFPGGKDIDFSEKGGFFTEHCTKWKSRWKSSHDEAAAVHLTAELQLRKYLERSHCPEKKENWANSGSCCF